MRIKREHLVCIGVFLALAAFFELGINAQEYEKNTAESEILGLGEAIPNELHGILPEGLFSGDYQKILDSIYETSDAEYLYNMLTGTLKTNLYSFFKLCARLIGIIVLTCVVNILKETFIKGNTKNNITFFADVALISLFVKESAVSINQAIEYVDSLNRFMSGVIPATAALYASGGNVKTAVVSTAGFMAFLSVSSFICNGALKIITSFCLALTVCSVLSPSLNLKSLTAFIKKTFATIIGFIMSILLFSMSAQNTLSAASDSLSARTAKFIIGNMIPIVGISISETIRTVSTSISFLRKTVGIGSIIIILFLFIPHLLGLVFTRAAYNSCGALADILGCERQGNLLREIGGIYAYIMAVTSMCSVMFIFALTMFAGSAIAIGGV